MILQSLDRFRDAGLLVLRVGIGLSYVFLHGLPKMMGGPPRWTRLGGSMGFVGIDVAPTFWGFMAAFSELVGGVLILLGFFFRPAAVLIFLTMCVAVASHFGRGQGWGEAAHAVKMAVLFFSLFFIGPGRYALDERFRRLRAISPF